MRTGIRQSLATLWLGLLLSSIAVLAAGYIYLHQVYPERGYFWISSKNLFAEIVSWSLFGSLIAGVIRHARTASSDRLFYAADLLAEAAQIISAPLLAALLCFLVYTPGDSEQTGDKGFVLLAFLTGLLTGHIWLLVRKPPEERTMNAFSLEPAEHITVGRNPATILPAEEPELYGFAALVTALIIPELDDAGLYYDERKELEQVRFDHTSVSLQNDLDGVVINAQKDGRGTGIRFVAADIEPGGYTIRALQSIRLKDNSVLNLFGEMKATIVRDDTPVLLRLKKLKI